MKILRSDVTKMATQTVPDFAFLHKKPKEQLLKKNQDVTERTLEHKVKREALSCRRPTRRVKKSSYIVTTLPSQGPLQPHGRHFSWPSGFPSGKGELRTVSWPVGATTLISHHGHCRGICRAQPPPKWDCTREGGGVATHKSWQTEFTSAVTEQ